MRSMMVSFCNWHTLLQSDTQLVAALSADGLTVSSNTVYATSIVVIQYRTLARISAAEFV